MNATAVPPANRVRDTLLQGRPAWGTWVQTRSPEAAEAAAATGFDFVVIDLQHGSASIAEAATLIRSVSSWGASPIVRTPDSSPNLIGRLLDSGAHGVLVPDIKTADQARAAVLAAQYAPAGTRGACPTIAATAHGAIPWGVYRPWADTEVMVWALIEHPEAIENIQEIAASGLHALVLGPFDLSLAMGLDGQVDHPDVIDALDRVVLAAEAAGIETVAVLFDEVPNIEKGARHWLDRGCRILTASSDRWALTQAWSGALDGLRDAGDACHK